MPRGEAYESFADELDRTAVISDGFKRRLRMLVQAVDREAYDQGVAQGRERVEREQPQPPEWATHRVEYAPTKHPQRRVPYWIKDIAWGTGGGFRAKGTPAHLSGVGSAMTCIFVAGEWQNLTEVSR